MTGANRLFGAFKAAKGALDLDLSLTIGIHPNDNVVIAREDIAAQTVCDADGSLTTMEHIPARHKIASRPIAMRSAVRKFDQVIGFATVDIAAGEHVHQHNCAIDEKTSIERPATVQKAASGAETVSRTFAGYQRQNGKVGTRNFLLVISSVNCSATVTRRIADQIQYSEILDQYPNVDGVFALTHGGGCGGPKGDLTDRYLSNVLWGYATHPNVAGVLLVGLGCEQMQIGRFMEEHQAKRSDLFQYLHIQSSGGSRQTVAAGVERMKQMLPIANSIERTECPANALRLALQCGGSDAWSGISANPALGAAVDLLVAQGGSAILAETPESIGAEHLLLARAENDDVARQLMQCFKWWKEYPRMFGGESLSGNVSHGNATGGLTTLWEKSLGAQAKSGTTPLRAFYGYGEPVISPGFVFMDSPGSDFVSVTGQIAAGAQLVCFTTGQGSAFGSKPAPCLKLASNTPLAERMIDDMDINCGGIVDGTCSVRGKGEEILEKILRVASGEQTKSEVFGYGDNECVPWQVGMVL